MKNNKTVSAVYDFASVLMTAVISVGVIFTLFFKISTVVGDSMTNTLHSGDNVIINSINTEFEYGDVVVISQPNGYEKVLIKRIIAVGGQTVSFDKARGTVSVDGKALDEPYIREPMNIYYDKQYEVPEGKLFVMGDNRNESADSRDPEVGLIEERYVLGKVIYRIGDRNIFNKEFNNA